MKKLLNLMLLGVPMISVASASTTTDNKTASSQTTTGNTTVDPQAKSTETDAVKKKAEAEAKQKAEAEAKQKAEAETKQKAEAETKQKAEAEAKQKAGTNKKETKLLEEADKIKKAADEKAKAEAEQKAANEKSETERMAPNPGDDVYTATQRATQQRSGHTCEKDLDNKGSLKCKTKSGMSYTIPVKRLREEIKKGVEDGSLAKGTRITHHLDIESAKKLPEEAPHSTDQATTTTPSGEQPPVAQTTTTTPSGEQPPVAQTTTSQSPTVQPQTDQKK